MSRTLLTDDAMRVVAEAATPQPALFSNDELGGELELSVVAAARQLCSPEVTGKISTADMAKASAVLMCLQAGMSRREIRRRVGVHHYTIDRIEEAAEKGGKLEPLNTRIRAALGRLVLDATHQTRETLNGDGRQMEDAAWLKAAATALGIATDKHQLLTGAPTEIIEQRSGPGRGDLEAWLAQSGLQVVAPAEAVDVQSPETERKPLQINAQSELTTGLHTEATPIPASGPGQPGASKGAGGGLVQAAAGTTVDGSSTPEISHE